MRGPLAQPSLPCRVQAARFELQHEFLAGAAERPVACFPDQIVALCRRATRCIVGRRFPYLAGDFRHRNPDCCCFVHGRRRCRPLNGGSCCVLKGRVGLELGSGYFQQNIRVVRRTLVTGDRWPAQFVHDRADVAKLVFGGCLAAAVEPPKRVVDSDGLGEPLTIELQCEHLQARDHSSFHFNPSPVFPCWHNSIPRRAAIAARLVH